MHEGGQWDEEMPPPQELYGDIKLLDTKLTQQIAEVLQQASIVEKPQLIYCV